MESWLPTIVSTFLVALVAYYMRSNRADIIERVKSMDGEIMKLGDRLSKDEDNYLTEEKHGSLCRITTLELKAYISEVLGTMQRQSDKRFDGLESLIKNGHGQ